MKVIEPTVEIYREPDHLRKIETIARVCTGTQDKVGSNPDFPAEILGMVDTEVLENAKSE